MPRPVDLSTEAMQEFATAANVTLDRDALGEFSFILDQTVGEFVRSAKNEAAWENEQFRSFILGQIRRIAMRVGEKATAAGLAAGADGRLLVGPDIIAAGAVEVMKATHEICEVAIQDGRIVGLSGTNEGFVCQTFLATQAS